MSNVQKNVNTILTAFVAMVSLSLYAGSAGAAIGDDNLEDANLALTPETDANADAIKSALFSLAKNAKNANGKALSYDTDDVKGYEKVVINDQNRKAYMLNPSFGPKFAKGCSDPNVCYRVKFLMGENYRKCYAVRRSVGGTLSNTLELFLCTEKLDSLNIRQPTHFDPSTNKVELAITGGSEKNVGKDKDSKAK